MNKLAETLLEARPLSKQYGFFGTLANSSFFQVLLNELVQPHYDRALKSVMEALNISEEEATHYLGSRIGRHLADQLLSARRLSSKAFDDFTKLAVKWYPGWKKSYDPAEYEYEDEGAAFQSNPRSNSDFY